MATSSHNHTQHDHNGGGHDLHHSSHDNSSHDHSSHDHSSHDHSGSVGDADHHRHMIADFRRRFFISLVLTVPIVLLSDMIQEWFGLQALSFPGDQWVVFALSTAVFFYGGWPFIRGAVSEITARNPGMMTLIGVAISVAYAYSSAVVFGLRGEMFFWELATLVDIMLLGHWIEMRSVLGASRALEKLVELLPEEAHRLRDDGSTEDVPSAELRHGDRIVVRPGERVPADGEIVEGSSSLNESMLTGESAPVEKSTGDEAVAGSINGDGALTVEVSKTGDETYLSQVVKLVEEAQQSRSRTQNLADRAARWLTFIALGAGAVTLAAWLTTGREFVFALERTVTVMVITCPHALGLAVPLVVAVSTALAAGTGLLIRNRAAFERARNVDAVLFDKTGTLTKGEFGVRDVWSADGDENEVLRLAASLERNSEHPIAQGVLAGAEKRGIEPVAVEDFEAIQGRGIRGTVEKRQLAVVSPGYLQENGISTPELSPNDLDDSGSTVVYLVENGSVLGAVALADVVREESRRAIEQLTEMGIRCMMVTGDRQEVAEHVAEQLSLDEVFAEVLPKDKADIVRQVQDRGLTVAMTGDGINDAPALATADIGIAVGAGTDVAIETADIVLARNNPQDVVQIVNMSQATYRKMVQNLWWAAGYNIVAIPLAAGVLWWAGILLSPAIGAVLMSASTVIVAVNAQLLKPASEK